MADNTYMSRGGRFSVRTPAPSTSPQPKTEGVVTKIETIVERVYAPSATAYTDGLVTKGEIIENYVTADGVQGKYRSPLPDQTSKMNEFSRKVQTEAAGSNRSAVPRGLFQRPTSNDSNTNSGTNDAGTNGWSKSTTGGPKDGANEWNRQATGGVANSTGASAWTKTTGGNFGSSEPSRQTGVGAKDISTNDWSSPTAGGINKMVTSDAGTTGWSKPIDSVNTDVGPNRLSGPGGGITTDGTPNRFSNPSSGSGAGAGGTNESRPTDGVNSTGTIPWRGSSVGPNNSSPSTLIKPLGGTNNTGSDGRNWLSSGVASTGGTDIGANGWNRPTGGISNESRPPDGISSTATSTWNRPSAVANNSGSNILFKSTGGTNDTGNDGRSWSSGAGAGGTDTGANRWNRPIDGTTNDIGPNGRRVLIGGTTPINESRPADGANSTGTIPWRGPSAGANYIGTRPTVGANNTDTGAWSKPIVGTSITGKDGRSGQTGGTNDTGADRRSGPSVMTMPQQKIDDFLDKNVPPLNPSSRVTPTIVTQDEYRPNRMGWASPPNYDISTSRPTISPGAVVQPRATQVPWAGQGQFSPSSVVPAKQPTTIIDSNEAARRYNGIATVAPVPTNRVIDSLQAAQKYKGVIIPSPRR